MSRLGNRIASVLVLVGLTGGGLVLVADPAAASSVVTTTYGYTGATTTFTVPPGVTSMTVTIRGGQGGVGGGDSQGSPIPGGYQGTVSGVVAVTPGDVITVAVGGGGGTGTSSRGSASGGSGGNNPLSGYDGSSGGTAGPAGSSGGGGGSGAASVLRMNATDIVAGGAGGNGGNGQFLPIVGRRAEDNHVARPDATSTTGRPGMNTSTVCSAGFRCDGGASGAGGGGAQGGDQGAVQYGGDTATEYFGFGGYPGANSTAGLEGLSATYDYYPANSADGSITISYDDGAPGAPQNLVGTAETGAVALAWNAPATGGSSPVSDYRVEYAITSTGPFTVFARGVSTALAADVTGLANGIPYFFRVAAINAEGIGVATTTAIGVVPSDVPTRPTVTGLVPFGGGIAVDFTPGASDSPITGYDYRLDAGEWSVGAVSANRLTISGLVNGRAYSVDVRAHSSIGVSDPSTPAQSATPVDVAQAPTALLATAHAGSVGVTWTAPTIDNGAVITDYVVQTAPSLAGSYATFVDGTSTSTTATVTGLTNGTATYLRVAAVNAVGVGAWSTPVIATPFTSPDAPSLVVVPGDGALTADITPGSDGGSVVTGYQYRLGLEGSWKPTGSLTTGFTVAGLTNGTAYDVFVRAVNAAGPGPASTIVSATPRTVPAAPAIAAVALDTGAVSVSFTVGSDGGSPLTNVQYSVDGGTTWITRSPASTASPLTIGSLVGGTTYPVVLRVVNVAGVSAGSNTSQVTAKGAPAAPIISLTAADRALLVVVTPPANGGTPITNYEYSVDGGSSWTTRSPASTSSPLLISGLTNATTYSVALRAVNAVGSGATSSLIAGVPRTVPGAPTIAGSTIVGVGGTLDVVFTAPVSDGGAPIVTYQYSTDAGATWRDRDPASTASPLQITAESADGTTPLVGGAPYPVEIRAVNAAGQGLASAVATGITTTVPAVPVIVTVDVRDASAAVHFTSPANGGRAIIRFEYRLGGSSGTWTDTGSLANELVITGLTNSVTYSLELRAVNSIGDGPATEAWSVPVFTTPAAPQLGVVTSGDATLNVAFVAGNDGGSAITGYEYSTDAGATWRARGTGTTGSPLAIAAGSGAGSTTLTNAVIYPVQLRAVNAAGAGAASETKLAAPRGVPAAPSAIGVAGGDGTLVVTFTSGVDGGSPITAIEYQLDGGDWVDPGSLSSPLTLAGLVNGRAYSVAVRARNAVGPGTASASGSGTPRSVPGVPTSVLVSGASHQITVAWGAPASDGGAAVTGYSVSLYEQAAGGTAIAGCTSSVLTCTISGLTNGSTVYAEVAALNAAGTGAASSPRLAQTPLAAPRVSIASITPGASDLSVAVAVVDGGGSPITAFQYELDGGSWLPAPTATSPFTIVGLTTGREYSIRIRAITAGGTGDPSLAVTAVPHTTPSAPTGVTATGAAGSAVLSWTAPAGNGGQPVTDYVVAYATSPTGSFTIYTDGISAVTSSTVTGLTNGTSYVFRVAAVNTAGNGPWSSLASATPRSAPSAATISTITSGSGFLQVAFTAPSANGGSAVTGYEYRTDGGAWRTTSATSSPMTITGLTNGQAYGVQLRAVNAVGGGTASALVSATPYGRPGAITGFRSTPTTNSVTLEWDAVDDNGSAIIAYNVIRWTSATEGSIAESYQTTATSRTFTGLTAGTYYFTIEATNAAGTGPRSAPRTTSIVGGTVPSAPSAVSTAVAGLATTMHWTAGAAGTSAITGYLVQYSTDDISWMTTSSSSSLTAAAFDLPSGSAPYALRLAAVSAVGVGAFATVRPPVAATGAVSGVGPTGATIAGSANANGAVVDVGFQVATAAAGFGAGSAGVVAATPASAAGSATTPVSADLAALAPGTPFLVRTVVTADGFDVRGATVAFATATTIVSSGLSPVYAGVPVVMTSVADPVGLALKRTFEGIGGTVYALSSVAPTTVGSYSVTTTPVNPAIGGAEVATLTITPRPVTVTVTAADRPYDHTTSAALSFGLVGAVVGDDVQVGASGISGAFDDAGAGVGKVVHITTSSALLTGPDAANYSPSIAPTVTATIRRATQALSFTSAAPSALASTSVGATYVPVVASTAGLLPSLAVGPASGAICSLSGGTVRLLAAGTCVLVATQTGTSDVEAAAAVEQGFSVVDPTPIRVPQTVAVEGLNDTALDAGPLVLPAATAANLPLTYTAGPPAVCTATGTTVAIHGLGTCVVTAAQAGDTTHLPATATAMFAVTAIVQVINIAGLGDVSIDASPLQLGGATPAGLPLTYAASPAVVCTVSGTVLTLVAEGTCTVTATQAGDDTHSPGAATTSFIVKPTMLRLSLQLKAGEVVADATVVVHGEGLKPNSEVRVELHSDPVLLGIVTTDAIGSFSTTVRMPQSVASGTHHIVAVGVGPDDQPITATEEIFVDWAGSFGDVQITGGYTPLTATRILDTREGSARVAAATELRLVVPAGLVPADVSAVVVNLTATDARHDGYVTVYPCGTTRPLAAAINFVAGETKANLVDAMYHAGGALCLWSNVDTDVVVDLQGFHSASGGARLVPRTAVRLTDTRPSGALVAGQVLQVQTVGAGKAAAGTSALALNVTVDAPQRAGFLTVYPCGTDRPWASNLNYVAGQTVSNEVIVQPGADGSVCVYTTAATHVVVDLDATYDASGVDRFTPLVPGRLGDTRPTTKVTGGVPVSWVVVGDGGAGTGTTAVSLNIAVTEPEGAGYLTVYPCGTPMPWASNLNFAAGQTISNHVTATVGANGKICVFSSRTTNVVVDVEGTYRPG